MDHPVAILPIACRRPSTSPLYLQPPALLVCCWAFSGRAWARDARPVLRFPRFQLCAAAAGGPYPVFSSSGVSLEQSRVSNHRLEALPFVLSYRTRKDRNMPDKSITKVSSAQAPKGRFGQKYLASGIHISIRLWEREPPGEAKSQTARDY